MRHVKYIAFGLLVVIMLASAATISAQGPQPGQPPGQGQPPQAQRDGNWSGVVQTVTSAALTVARTDNTSFTATITSTTKIESMLTQNAIAVTNVQVGNNVVVEGRRMGDTSVAAARIMVEPSGVKVLGSVSAIAGATITLATPNSTMSVVTNSDTKFYKGKTTGSLSDVAKGAMVVAYGVKQSEGSLVATYILVNAGQGDRQQPPQEQPTRSQTPPAQATRTQPQPGQQPPQQGQPPVQGQPGQGQPEQGDWSGAVQTVTNAALTVARANAITFTATISSATKIESLISGSALAVTDIQVGNNVTIEGRRGSDTSVAAVRILVEPSGAKVSGAVSTLSGATLTLAMTKDKNIVVTTTSDTKFYKGKTVGALTDVTKGAVAVVYGIKQADGSLTATYVLVNDAPGQGQPAQVAQGGRPTQSAGESATEQPSPTPRDNNPFNMFINWLRERFQSR